MNLLKESLKRLIEEELCDIISDLEYSMKVGNLNKENFADVLLLLSILYSSELVIMKGKEKFIYKTINTILKSYKKDIEEGNHEYFTLYGFHSGIGAIVYSLNILGKKYTGLESFVSYFNEMLINMIEQYLNYVKKDKENIKFAHYDTIAGASGYLYNIIKLFPNDYEDLKENLVEYLIELSEDIYYKNEKIIGYHIKCENQHLATERKNNPDGHINFGLAHGIIGPLVALSEAKKCGYEFKNLEKSIHKLKKLYETFEKNNYTLKYPTHLSYNSFKNNIFLEKEYSFNSSWCYGNLGIIRALMIVNLNLYDKYKYEYYKNCIINIFNSCPEDYNLISSCLCHGYASVVSIQLSVFLETGDYNTLGNINRNVDILISTYKEEMKIREGLRYDMSLIEGRIGIILTLLSLLTSNLSFKDIIFI